MMRARARVERRARQESERVDPACRRLGEISSRRRRDCGLACGGAGAMRGARTRPRSPPGETRRRNPHQVPDPKRPDVPLPGGGPVRGHPRRRLTNARRERRRVDACDFYLGLAVLRTMARARGRGPRKRARRRRRRDRDGSLPRARAENASSSRASRVPVRGSSAPRRKAAREAVRRRTTKAPLDSFRRHRTGGDDPCVGGSDCLSREFENFRFADSRVPRVFFSRRC
jgi:hypothetical protein